MYMYTVQTKHNIQISIKIPYTVHDIHIYMYMTVRAYTDGQMVPLRFTIVLTFTDNPIHQLY